MVNAYEFFECTRVREMEVGKRYLVSSKDAVSPMTENGGIFPWGDVRTKIPVECIEEHEHFYTLLVLPHWSHFCCFGKSKLYRVTATKKDIALGEFKVYQTEEELICESEEEAV